MNFPILPCSVPDLPPVGYAPRRGVELTTQTLSEGGGVDFGQKRDMGERTWVGYAVEGIDQVGR